MLHRMMLLYHDVGRKIHPRWCIHPTITPPHWRWHSWIKFWPASLSSAASSAFSFVFVCPANYLAMFLVLPCHQKVMVDLYLFCTCLPSPLPLKLVKKTSSESSTNWVDPYFVGWSLETGPKFGGYSHFCGAFIDVCNF